MKGRLNGAGYSLVEMLLVLILVVLIQALATPALSGIVNSSRLNSSAEALFNSLLLARSEAAKRNARVVVCKSATGDACAISGGWHQGWIVFHDANHNGALDHDESVLHREAALPALVRLTGNGPVSNYVSYTPMGRTVLISGAFQAGTLTACVQSTKQVETRQIVINSSGRARLAKSTLQECL